LQQSHYRKTGGSTTAYWLGLLFMATSPMGAVFPGYSKIRPNVSDMREVTGLFGEAYCVQK